MLRPYLEHRPAEWYYLVEVADEIRSAVTKLLPHGKVIAQSDLSAKLI